ncbi:MAG: hypothetical protein U5R06_04350 [candidate division KSB1 bacterium]|nr:hypothetical protein [candidate division KSB1 bacterium]
MHCLRTNSRKEAKVAEKAKKIFRFSSFSLCGVAPRRALFQEPIHAKKQRSQRKAKKIFRFSFSPSAALRLGVHLFKNQFTQRSKGRREKRKRYSGFLSLPLRRCASACIFLKTNSRKETKVAKKSEKDIPVFFLSLCGVAPRRALFQEPMHAKKQRSQRKKMIVWFSSSPSGALFLCFFFSQKLYEPK